MKRTVFVSFAAMLILSTAVTAQAAHTHEYNIFNRVMANRRRGKYTRVYVDEAHLYFKNPYSADFLLKCWKRFRKYGGLLTGITQNISDCLLNETARGMLSNSEFLLLLNQAPSDRKDL